MVMETKKIVAVAKTYAVPLLIAGLVATFYFIGKADGRKPNDFLRDHITKLSIDSNYTKQASILMDYYYKENVCMRFQTVKTTLMAIDKYIDKYFPEKQFTRKDFIALALTETTNFDQYTIGSCGEYGIFQIMPDMCKAMGVKKNHFDIYVNTELAMFVLKEKYKKHQDYYKAIIAYNGVIVNPQTQRWRDKYWKRFLNYRKDVDIIFGEE